MVSRLNYNLSLHEISESVEHIIMQIREAKDQEIIDIVIELPF